MAGDVNVFFNGSADDDDVGAESGRYAVGEVEVMIAERGSRRKGLAREALTMMMDYCSRELSTSRFVAKIKDHNGASCAVCICLECGSGSDLAELHREANGRGGRGAGRPAGLCCSPSRASQPGALVFRSSDPRETRGPQPVMLSNGNRCSLHRSTRWS